MPALCALTFLVGTLNLKAAGEFAITDPAQGGLDYEIQGEYAGENCGAQVIALGEGKFRAVGWTKGLPGEVSGAERKLEVEGELKEGKVALKNTDWDAVLENGEIKGVGADGKTVVLKKVVRKSPTFGLKPPQGARVLFEGKNADAFTKGELDGEGNLKAGVLTKDRFKSFTLHLEFKTPFMPKSRGQNRGNSGVITPAWFEVQVLDSFGLSGENNECGGIYNLYKPAINMCYPPLTWQTYDIEFEAPQYKDGTKVKQATLTVKHNGVVVQDQVELNAHESSSPIELQDHGDPVVYRNVWVVEK